MKLRLSFILIFITIIFVFLIFFKSLYEDKVYIPKQLNNKIENISAKEFYSDDNMELKNLFEDHEYILINIWASWCLPCRQEHPYITKISKFDNKEKLRDAFILAKTVSREKKVIIESYLQRQSFQIAGDGFYLNKKKILFFFAKEHFSKKPKDIVPVGESYPHNGLDNSKRKK